MQLFYLTYLFLRLINEEISHTYKTTYINKICLQIKKTNASNNYIRALVIYFDTIQNLLL